MKLYFQVPGRPKPKERPRFGKGHAHKSKKAEADEEWVRWHLLRAMKAQGIKQIEGPIKITCFFFYKKPLKAKNDYPFEGYADFDNLEKLVCDACNKLPYKDDCLITKGTTQKSFSDEDASYVMIETNNDIMLSSEDFRTYWKELVNA